MMAPDQSKGSAQYDNPSSSEYAQQSRHRPLIGQITHDISLEWIKGMESLR